ncbi:MAG: phosphatase domain-containing protein [Myxococcaceae bacterium]
MPVKLPPNPTAAQFAEAWTKEILEPAVKALAGRDGRLSATEAGKTSTLTGAASHAADNLKDVFQATGAKSSAAVSTVLAAGRRYALEAAQRAAGADGRISAADMAKLASLQADFSFLRGPERYSNAVAQSVLAAHGLSDLPALLQKATELGNGNGYLARPELEAAARALATRAPELGIVSDLDSTVIPPGPAGTLPAPYPGVTALYRELEFGNGGKAGDTRYVTARSPDRVTELPDYLNAHELPAGTLPWVAQPEKVADISRIFEAHPGQKFVLFGDSKHKDPEVYKEILRKYPDQVSAVIIHKVNATVSPTRVEGMELIGNYAEAAAVLMGKGVIDEAAARRVMKSAQAGGLAITDAQIEQLIAAQR